MMGRGMESGRPPVSAASGELDFMAGPLAPNWREECCRVFGVGQLAAGVDWEQGLCWAQHLPLTTVVTAHLSFDLSPSCSPLLLSLE